MREGIGTALTKRGNKGIWSGADMGAEWIDMEERDGI